MDYLIYNLSNMTESAADIALLPPDEQEQAANRGLRYVIIRTLLRQELSRRCGQLPQNIRLLYGPHGKPDFATQPFNISHSDDYLCIAFHHRAIGVDIERIRPRAFASLARRFMSPEQLLAFSSRGCRQEEFYACWCAAEAIIKHAGDTIWHAHQYPFSYHHGQIKCHFENAPSLYLFTPVPGYCGAVAYTPE